MNAYLYPLGIAHLLARLELTHFHGMKNLIPGTNIEFLIIENLLKVQ